MMSLTSVLMLLPIFIFGVAAIAVASIAAPPVVA